MSVDSKTKVIDIITDISSLNISMAQFERTFDLPKRTLARWKQGHCSASGMALLTLVQTYPWLLDLAEATYAKDTANYLLVKNAGVVINNVLDKCGGGCGGRDEFEKG